MSTEYVSLLLYLLAKTDDVIYAEAVRAHLQEVS